MRDDDYKSFADTLVASGRKTEIRDYNLALSGVEAGQQQRFVSEEHSPQAQEEKKAKEYAALSALMRRLMNDPTYAAYYNETMEMLTEAEKAADQAMAYFAAQRAETQRALQEMLESATYLKGHGAVFKDEHGAVRLLDGTVIDDPVLLDSIVWKDNSPSYEDAARIWDQDRHVETSFEDSKRYRYETLGDVRETMEDEDGKVSTKDMEQIRDIITEQDLTFGSKELANNISDLKQLPNLSMAASQPSL